jgi:hypothetical protein
MTPCLTPPVLVTPFTFDFQVGIYKTRVRDRLSLLSLSPASLPGLPSNNKTLSVFSVFIRVPTFLLSHVRSVVSVSLVWAVLFLLRFFALVHCVSRA